jgi:hypothetical protein
VNTHSTLHCTCLRLQSLQCFPHASDTIAMSVSLRAKCQSIMDICVRSGIPCRSRVLCRLQSSKTLSELAQVDVEHISSVQNKHVKHCVRLRTSSSYRSETGTFLLTGATVLNEQFHRGAKHTPDVRSEFACPCPFRTPIAQLRVLRPIVSCITSFTLQGIVCAPLQILTLFIDSQEECSVPIPDHIVSYARNVVTVDRHVMKKLAGVQEAASIGAVAEVLMPPVLQPAFLHSYMTRSPNFQENFCINGLACSPYVLHQYVPCLLYPSHLALSYAYQTTKWRLHAHKLTN